jgi:hypothetical protein
MSHKNNGDKVYSFIVKHAHRQRAFGDAGLGLDNASFEMNWSNDNA